MLKFLHNKKDGNNNDDAKAILTPWVFSENSQTTNADYNNFFNPSTGKFLF